MPDPSRNCFSRYRTVFFCLIMVQFLLPGIVQAQTRGSWKEVHEFKHNYATGTPFRYSPKDPWISGKVYRDQAGYSGHYYNCDGEECKRFSPYIYWTCHDQPNFPSLRDICASFRCDIVQTKQRIIDGAGDCAHGCHRQGCSRCSAKRRQSTCSVCGENGCANCQGDGFDDGFRGAEISGPGNGPADQQTFGGQIEFENSGRQCSSGQCSSGQCSPCGSGNICKSGACAPQPFGTRFGKRNSRLNKCGCADPLPDESSLAGLLIYEAPVDFLPPAQSGPANPDGPETYVEPQPEPMTSIESMSQMQAQIQIEHSVKLADRIGSTPSAANSAKTCSCPQCKLTATHRVESPDSTAPLLQMVDSVAPCNCAKCQLKVARIDLAVWNEQHTRPIEEPTRTADASNGFRLNRITADTLRR